MTDTPQRDRPPVHALDVIDAQAKALRRAGPANGAGAPASTQDRRSDSWAHIDSMLHQAVASSQPRNHWPAALDRFPFRQVPFAKRFILKVMRAAGHDQRRATTELTQGVRLLMSRSIHLEEQLFAAIHEQRRWQTRALGAEQRLDELHAHLADQSRLRVEDNNALEERMGTLDDAVATRLESLEREHRAQAEAAQARVDAIDAEAQRRQDAVLAKLDDTALALERRVTLAVAAARTSFEAAGDRSGTVAVGAADDLDLTVMPGFYARFEAAFRGPQELIHKRQEYYMPRFEVQPDSVSALSVADLGCGRGEFLDLLRARGIATVGVDLNPDFLAMVAEKGHSAVNEDAVAWTERQEPGSLRGITAFHVIEHISIGQMVRLLAASYRALAKGGVLIFETPNPENVIVGACNFWIDPTHKRPVVPDLLGILAKEVGFEAPQLVRLNEFRLENPLRALPPEHELAGSLNPLIEAVGRTHFAGPDYALVAVRQ